MFVLEPGNFGGVMLRELEPQTPEMSLLSASVPAAQGGMPVCVMAVIHGGGGGGGGAVTRTCCVGTLTEGRVSAGNAELLVDKKIWYDLIYARRFKIY